MTRGKEKKEVEKRKVGKKRETEKRRMNNE
jgi:hypothetical protein